MGRNKAKTGKDRAYVTASEWASEGGGKRRDGGAAAPFRRLPFDRCAISFLPFENAVCAPDGSVFDVSRAVPYVMKHKRHPVSGEALEVRDLIALRWHKNADGAYECPVMKKTFTDSTRIVCVRTTGNVYCAEAIEELCVKAKNWKDLLTEEPFKRSDVITLQDPLDLKSRTLEAFDHVKRGIETKNLGREVDDSNINKKGLSEDMRRVLDALGSEEAAKIGERGGSKDAAAARDALELAKKKEKEDNARRGIENKPDPTDNSHLLRGPAYVAPVDNITFKPGSSTWDTSAGSGGATLDLRTEKEKAKRRAKMAPYLVTLKTRVNEMRTTGHSAMGFTSTTMEAHTKNHRAEEVVWTNPKKKAYVRLHTNMGDLNIELHCESAPRTCENFITLAEKGYYDGVKFHRSIKNFMLQGGDPTGTGRGGHCIWGEKFNDEFQGNHHRHVDRGVLSMANSGKNTNGSQFFITYKPTPHLDNKHTVFGRVVGGMETLQRIEDVPTDAMDRPTQTVKITSCTVFANPYTELRLAEEKAEREAEEAKAKAEAMKNGGAHTGKFWSDPATALAQASQRAAPVSSTATGVGKYVAATVVNTSAPLAKKPKQSGGFSNFDSW